MLAVLRAKGIDNVVIHCVDIHDEPGRAVAWLADFDVIVASAVCGELPDYPLTMQLLAGALKPGGRLVQWDWIASDEEEDDDGLTLEDVANAFEGAGLAVVLVDHAFDVTFGDDDVPVLIGVARKPA
jgi:SAM-dependent methyltransferase